jgi:hypothetical protein
MSIRKEYFVYGLVTPEEWDYKSFGKSLAKQLKKKPTLYMQFDAYKILGLINKLHELEESNETYLDTTDYDSCDSWVHDIS